MNFTPYRTAKLRYLTPIRHRETHNDWTRKIEQTPSVHENQCLNQELGRAEKNPAVLTSAADASDLVASDGSDAKVLLHLVKLALLEQRTSELEARSCTR